MQIVMKKNLVMAAIVALTGVGSYLGYRSTTPTNAGESDLLLANAEALAHDEITIRFNCFHFFTETDHIILDGGFHTYKCIPCGQLIFVTSVREGDTCDL